MKLPEMLQAAHDFWRPNRYGLKPYLVNDGKKHPFAVICPGGGYSMVCSFVEGKPFAQALNERGYHAFVVYYRVKRKALYPAPHDDLERAKEAAYRQGVSRGVDPFMTLSFIPLPVIPKLRLTTRGVVDVDTQQYI